MIYILISGNASLPGGTRPHLGAMYPHLGAMRPHLGATRPRVGIVKLGLDAPTWQYNDKRGRVLYLLAKASSLGKQMPTRGRVAPR